MDKPVLAIDTYSPFGTYKLDARRAYARNLAQKFKTKPVINLIRQVGGLRSCAIADVEVYGTKMRVYPGLNRSDKIMLGMPHMFDAAERKILAEHLAKTKNPSFVDIGANIGAYSAFVNGLGFGTKIIAIEADPEMFARLNFNLPDNITKLNIAVADKEGTLPFYIHETNRGENSLKEGSGKKIEVPAKTLLQIMAENKMQNPSAIKIDVEGMEEVILKKFFADAKRVQFPALILVEHIHNDAVIKLLNGLGYKQTFQTKLNGVFVLE